MGLVTSQSWRGFFLPRWEIAMARPFGIAWSAIAGRFSAFGKQVPSKWAGPMPRYYFDNRDGEKLVPDDTGVVLPSIEQARDQAAQALAELAKDVLAGSIHRELATEIRNEAGEPLLRATLVFEVERLRWLLSAGSAARRHR
jgi:hypothetical protein